MARKEPIRSDAEVVQFHYIKSGVFRTVHVSGAIGSVTPSGDIHCAVFNERPAIPRVTQHTVDKDGVLQQDSIVVDGRDGFVRELEVDMIMSVDTARDLRGWLEKKIGEAEKFNAVRVKVTKSKSKGDAK